MEITPSGVLGMIHRLQLTPTAIAVLGIMSELQASGGAVNYTQVDMAERLGVLESAVSRGMKLLVARNLVIRSGDGRGHSYRLHPFIAKYSSEREMEAALRAAAVEVREGRMPDIAAPLYRKQPPRAGRPNLVAV
ncbi:MarR family transcriptional regulator [Kitasatospora azatica]|uniref:MarR family transcriptional regulator n=1 Tax=Kitasatospora azatica TaxID=58347 RepID=UPI0007C84E8F|nr:helix-turn-helix domain-containing protein [Kitasatospora azatica]